jgi:hypothetical protein
MAVGMDRGFVVPPFRKSLVLFWERLFAINSGAIFTVVTKVDQRSAGMSPPPTHFIGRLPSGDSEAQASSGPITAMHFATIKAVRFQRQGVPRNPLIAIGTPDPHVPPN